VVIFSDILIVPQAMGLEVKMAPGPVFPSPILSPADFSRLNLTPDASTAFAPLYRAIASTRRAAAAEGKAVPVIGFCGAPWTLMSYMVGPAGRPAPDAPPGAPHGAGKDSTERARAWLYSHRAESHFLLAALAKVCADLLVGAWAAGASILQVFESGGGDLTPALFSEFALPYMKEVASLVRARTPAVSEGGPLLIVFPRGQHAIAGLEGLCDSAFDAIGLDWGWDQSEAASRVAAECARLGRKPMALQGNLDPAALFAPRDALRKITFDMLTAFGDTPLVANLGHGMLPSHDPIALGEFFQAVKDFNREKLATLR
jgi:uroporphyrinogen decarboxylase